jgi:phage terminase large subunit GpA-like protein
LEAQSPDALRAELPSLPHGRDVLFAELAARATPEIELTVSEHADRYRVVSSESGSPFPGAWRTARVPYVREPQDCLHPDHPARQLALKWSAQTAKTEIGVNWFCFIVDRAAGPTMIVLPTGNEATKYNRVKLQPTIDASPRIRHRVKAENSRDEGASTAAFKRFGGGFCQIVTASSSKGLQMVSIRWLILDEVSGYLRDVDGRGSPSGQARKRQKAFGDLAKELAISTPGMAGECEISELYEASDRRRFYLPCPHCRDFGVLKYENMHPPGVSTGWRAAFGCEACGGIIDQSSREAMLAGGRWVPTWVREGAEEVPAIIPAAGIDSWAIPPCEGRVVAKQPGYALWAAYSPMESWTDIWKRGEEARGDSVKQKVFTQQDLGEAYEPKSDTPDWEKLLGVRKPWRRGIVPYPGAILTGFVDVQGNRFEWGLWAWGEGFQGWLVDRGIIAYDHTADGAGWAALDALTARRWETAGGGEIAVMQWGIDTGAFTQALYDKVSKRHALLATKGDNKPRSAPFKKTRADLRGPDGRPIAGRRIDLGLIGNFDLKVSVYDGLGRLVAGPDAAGKYPGGTLHLPDWIGEDELKQLTAETLVDPRDYRAGAVKRGALVKAAEVREWRKRPHQPNEALDIVVGCRALAWGEGAGQISAQRWRELAAEAHASKDSKLAAPAAAGEGRPGPTEPNPAEAPPGATGLGHSPMVPRVEKPREPREESIDDRLSRLGASNQEHWG